MRLRSRGLGRKELVMDFREYDAVREGDEVVVVGTIRDPVNWDFTIRVCEDDIAGLTRLVLKPAMIGLLIRGFFKRKKHYHWSDEQSEHVAEGKRRLAVAKEKAVERAKSCMAPVAVRKRATVAREARATARAAGAVAAEAEESVAESR